jgi:citronellol/citronellal dehydrogenase
VIVSGGTGSIGRAIGFLFARLGAHVIIVRRNAEKTGRARG